MNDRPELYSTTAAASPSSPTTIATASHSAKLPFTLPTSRVSMPRSDWFCWSPTNPVRPAWKKLPSIHQYLDGPGSTANPMMTVPANTATATAACRNRLVSTR